VSRPNVGDRFPFMMEVEPSNVVHSTLDGKPGHAGITQWAALASISPAPLPGKYRTVMAGSKVLSSPGVFEMQIRINGEPVGDILESNSTEENDIVNTKTQDFDFEKDDIVELWGRYPEGWIMRVDEFSVKSSLAMAAINLDPDPN